MPSQFRVYRALVGGNVVNQTGLIHNDYTKVLFTHAELNDNFYYDLATNRLYPPPGKRFILNANIWYGGNFRRPPVDVGYPEANPCLKFWLNGKQTERNASPGWTPGGFPNTAGACIGLHDRVTRGGDYLELYAFSHSMNGQDDVWINGHPRHTYFEGTIFDD